MLAKPLEMMQVFGSWVGKFSAMVILWLPTSEMRTSSGAIAARSSGRTPATVKGASWAVSTSTGASIRARRSSYHPSSNSWSRSRSASSPVARSTSATSSTSGW
jgi:hypothetical protein